MNYELRKKKVSELYMLLHKKGLTRKDKEAIAKELVSRDILKKEKRGIK